MLKSTLSARSAVMVILVAAKSTFPLCTAGSIPPKLMDSMASP